VYLKYILVCLVCILCHLLFVVQGEHKNPPCESAQECSFGGSSASDPAGRAYNALPDPAAGLRGLLPRRWGGKGGSRERSNLVPAVKTH